MIVGAAVAVTFALLAGWTRAFQIDTAPTIILPGPTPVEKQAGPITTFCVTTNGIFTTGIYGIYTTNDVMVPQCTEVCSRVWFTKIDSTITYFTWNDASFLFANCGNDSGIFPFWKSYIENFLPTRSVLEISGPLAPASKTTVLSAGGSSASKCLCIKQTFTASTGRTCFPNPNPPSGEAYAIVNTDFSRVRSNQADWLCSALVTDDPFIVGTFINLNESPIPSSILSSIYDACPSDNLAFTLLNSLTTIPGIDIFTIQTFYAQSGTVTRNVLDFLLAASALCSMKYSPCPLTYSSWFLQSNLPKLTTESFSSLCSGQISGGFSGVFQTPADSDVSGLNSVVSACNLQGNVYTNGEVPTTESFGYGWCSYEPIIIPGSTVFITTDSVTVPGTITSTRVGVTSTETNVSVSFTTVTTFLLDSTSLTTTSTTTLVFSSISSTSTTTTTTTTRTRILSDTTTTTLSVSLTFTETETTRSTASFTETINSTDQTTITRTILRSYCQPESSTVTQTLFSTLTEVVNELTTVYVDEIIWITSTEQDPPGPPLTRTVQSTSTDVVVKTSVAFKKQYCGDNCPDIEAIVCRSGIGNPLVYMFNNLPYDLADCACKAIGKSILVVKTDQDFLNVYDIARECGGRSGQAWVQVAADFTRCYLVSSEENMIIPAYSCDIAIPVICA